MCIAPHVKVTTHTNTVSDKVDLLVTTIMMMDGDTTHHHEPVANDLS